MAQVDRDGPFSRFEDVDRTLVLFNGAMTLRGEEREIKLIPGTEPFSFEGEQAITAVLDGGSALDLNVMTRRDRARHTFWRDVFGSAMEIAAIEGHTTLLFALEPGLSVAGEPLQSHDTALIGPQTARVTTHAGRLVSALIIDIVDLHPPSQ